MIRAILTLTISSLMTATASAQTLRPSLDHASVLTIMSTCESWASERELTLTIAIIDQSSNLRGYLQMDEAFSISWLLAEKKAHSALALQRPTSQLGFLEDVPALETGGELVRLRGGIDIRSQAGEILGAVGVSGASSAEDEDCAIAGVEAAGLTHGVVAEAEE